MKDDKLLLFSPSSFDNVTGAVSLGKGQQITFLALGIEGDEPAVEFELIFDPPADVIKDSCNPPPVKMPSVVASSPLYYKGEKVELSKTRNYFVMTAPQQTYVRAIIKAEETDHLYVWALSTETPTIFEN